LRKIFTILLLGILIISQFGYYSYCIYQIYEAKEVAHEQLLKQLPENLLTKIDLQNNIGIQWEEEGKEFKLNGEMYDVVRTSNENGKTYLYCFGDKNEDKVLKKFENVVKNCIDNSSNSDKSHNTAKITMPEWVFEVQDISINGKLPTWTPQQYINYTPALCSRSGKINHPPPNFIL